MGVKRSPFQSPERGRQGDGKSVEQRLRRWVDVGGREEEEEPLDVGYSGNNVHNRPPAEKGHQRVGIRDRVNQISWAWFTMTMATGGLANVLHSVPFRSNWLEIVGVILFLFNIVLFLVNCLMISYRFKSNTGSFRASFIDSSESLFISCSIVSLGTIFINTCQYGIGKTGQWLETTMAVMFWCYAAIAMVTSVGIYLTLWSTQSFPIHYMTPIWIFPGYPLLLLGPFASNLISAVPDAAAAMRIHSLAIALTATAIQGCGFMVSLMIYSAFIYRLMTQKLPRETTRPGVFVSVGPSGFTVAGIVSLGNNLQSKILPGSSVWGTADIELQDAAFFLKILADVVGIWIFSLCIWFFLVSVGSHWTLLLPPGSGPQKRHSISFAMTWFSYVFPNTALITATLAIGKTFKSRGIQIFGCVLTGILVVVWVTVFSLMVRALIRKRLLWPAEDVHASRRGELAKEGK